MHAKCFFLFDEKIFKVFESIRGIKFRTSIVETYDYLKIVEMFHAPLSYNYREVHRTFSHLKKELLVEI